MRRVRLSFLSGADYDPLEHMIPGLHGPWLPCAALVLVAVVLWRYPRPGRGEVRLLGTMIVGAAVVRLVCGVWGPLHVNGQGPLWIRGALDPDALVGYGPGYFELFTWVTRLGGMPDNAVFAANAILSALSPVLLYAVGRLTGIGRGGALAAALVLAVDPVTVRTAASEGYFSSLIALVLGVQTCLTLGLRAGRRGDRSGAGLALVAAGLFAAAAARIHPMSYLPLALCPLVVFGAAQSDGWVARVERTLAAGAAVGAAVLLTSGDVIITALRASEMTSHASGGLVRRDWQMLVAALVAVWCLRRWVRPPWLPLLGIFSLGVMLATQDSFQQHPMWKHCYQRLFLPGVLLGAAPLLPRRLQGPVWAFSGAVVAALALLWPALPHLGTSTTEQLEYRFLQKVLRGMPPACTVAGVSRAGRRLWEIPSYLVPMGSEGQTGGPRALERASDLEVAPESGNCLLYVRASLCTSVEARALCESVEREAQLEQIASGVFPAVPSYAGLPYDRSAVEVVVFRVAGSVAARGRGQATVSDGAAITPAFAQTLYDRLIPLRESDGCRVVRLDTSRFRMTVGVQARSGEEHSIELATALRNDGGRRAGGWALAVPSEVERDCAVTLATIERVLGDLERPAPIGDVDEARQRRLRRWAFTSGAALLALAVCSQWLAGKAHAQGQGLRSVPAPRV